MDRLFFLMGTILALIGVAAGAFGAHSLRGRLDADMLAIFEVGVRYQMYHALALLAVAWAQTRWPGPLVSASGWLFLIGTLLFSGSLYLLSLTGSRWLGAITRWGDWLFWAVGSVWRWLCGELKGELPADSANLIREDHFRPLR